MPTPRFTPTQLLQALSQTIPPAAIAAALEQTGKREQRRRKPPSTLVVQLAIALGLLSDVARRQALATLLPQASPLPGKRSISRACYRVGPRPLLRLFEELAQPLAQPDTMPQAFHHGLRLLALDAAPLALPDTPANARVFGRHRVGGGAALFPQLKLVTLAEVGTHALLGLRLRPGERSERLPGLQLLQQRGGPGQLWLWDRGFYSYRWLRALRGRGAQFLGRVPAQVRLPVDQALPDGSYLSHVNPPAGQARRQGWEALVVRVIEYRVGARGAVIRLVTSLLDAAAHPALELAQLYQERWEVELLFDELKTHQQGRPNGQPTAVRAQEPAGVVQEVYGLALAHGVVRTLMAAAALERGVDPDRLSFKNALVIVRRYLPPLAQATAEQAPPLLPG